MNKLAVSILSATAFLSASEKPIHVTAQTVDSEKAAKSVWEYTNFAQQVKRELATFNILQVGHKIKKTKVSLQPLLRSSLILDLATNYY